MVSRPALPRWTSRLRWLAARGNYNELVSTGVHDPLFAKAMVLSQGQTTVAFVGNDLCSVPRELTDRARQRASDKTGIPFANIVITATHTHVVQNTSGRCAISSMPAP